MALGEAIVSAINGTNQLIGNIVQMGINEHWNRKNYNFQREQFNYQKYLNNNQIQIQSADARKAGINPLAMTGGNLTAGNYTNSFSPSGNPVEGMSGILSGLARIIADKDMNDNNNETSRSNNKDSNDTEKEIADSNNKTQKKIAEINAKSQEKQALLKIMSEEKMHSDTLAENQYQFDVNNERYVRQLETESRETAVTNLQKAYETWFEMVYHQKISSGESGDVASRLYSDIKKMGENAWKFLTGDTKKFYDWYIQSGFQIDVSDYTSSVRRRN